jgi:hypothetical protein
MQDTAPLLTRTADDEMLRMIQLRVARRADEFARQRVHHTGLDLDCWLMAEAEYFREASGQLATRSWC